MTDSLSPLSEADACKFAFVMAIKDTLNVVSGKWKLAIVCTLLRGPRRFNEVERLLQGLSPRMLARELRELEVNGVVAKVQGATAARNGWRYQLTPSGQQLESVIIGMAQWGQDHRVATAALGLPVATPAAAPAVPAASPHGAAVSP